MLCCKFTTLTILILYSALQKEEAAGKTYKEATKNKKEVDAGKMYIVATKNKKEVDAGKTYIVATKNKTKIDASKESTPEAENRGNRIGMGSKPEIKKERCSCGKPGGNGKIIGGVEAKPNEFPWTVRIFGGCVCGGNAECRGLCGGSLITRRIILSAFHCAVRRYDTEMCDHSDGKRRAVIGKHIITPEDLRNKEFLRKYTIPIIEARSPPNGWLTQSKCSSHDFALFILKRPANFLPGQIGQICLPHPSTKLGGERAMAAGWGLFDKPWVNRTQSPVLRKVILTVSSKKYCHKKMFGTILSKNNHYYKDPCSGDSGGPLMRFNNPFSRVFTIIGTVSGGGYNCRTNQVNQFEGSDNGVWNKVGAHMKWIRKIVEELGEKVCKDYK